MKDRLVIGSRGSQLALRQTRLIQEQLSAFYPHLVLDVEIIKTSGDVKTEPLSVIGGKGVFTKELEDALVDGRIDIAVHSLKDLPTIVPDKLAIAAFCEREDSRDALVLRNGFEQNLSSLNDLHTGAIVGTSSQRRLAQLKHLRSDVVVNDVRGNVDTRLRKLDEGQYDALILATAGLRRMSLEGRINTLIPISEMLPAVGQGALAIETRASDEGVIEIVRALDHQPTRVACTAERAFLRALGGGCQLPIAGYAVESNGQLSLEGLVADRDGQEIVRGTITGASTGAESLGTQLAAQLLKQGADRLLA
jgi:hydroxymethylbilane synthase